MTTFITFICLHFGRPVPQPPAWSVKLPHLTGKMEPRKVHVTDVTNDIMTHLR